MNVDCDGLSPDRWPDRVSRASLGGMDKLFGILIPVSLAAVLVALLVGLYALFKGGDFGRSYSNRLMRLRVLLQFIAILILVAALWWRKNHGG